jgi:sortase A
MKARRLSVPLILLGIVFYSCALAFIWQRTTPSRLAFKNFEEITTVTTSSSPVAAPEQLIIPNLLINLPISPAKIQNGSWEISTIGVSYLSSSPLPGSTGNSILYGHNWQVLLGKLVYAKPLDEILITYADGSTRVFEVVDTKEVTPNDVSILNQTKDRRITLYTCTGFLDSKRFVVTATLKRIIEENHPENQVSPQEIASVVAAH